MHALTKTIKSFAVAGSLALDAVQSEIQMSKKEQLKVGYIY
jgi:hypothetical protein